MLPSKRLLEITGISRATLNNYIALGILPSPTVLPPQPEHGRATRMGYFPDDALSRVEDVQKIEKTRAIDVGNLRAVQEKVD